MWIAELKGAETAADRIDAARALAKFGGTKVVDRELQRALVGDSFWGVQAAAAASLGKIRSPYARDALIKALGAIESHHARRAVVKALGSFRRDEKAASALAEVAAGDPSYRVEAEALCALGKIRSPGAAEILIAALDRESFFDIIRQQAFAGLGELGDPEQIDHMLAGTNYGRPSFGRRAAARAMATIARGRGDHIARTVRERLEELLDDPDFRVQAAAISSLGLLGDAAATTALQRAAERDLDGRLRRRSLEVIRDLAEGRAHSDANAALLEQVEALERRVVELGTRVAKLEATSGGVRKGTSTSGSGN